MTLAVPSKPADQPSVTASGRHRVVAHRCRTLPVALVVAKVRVLAVSVGVLARSAVAAVNWRPLATALTFTAGVALLCGMVEEGWEFAFSGEVWDLLTAVAFLVAASLYGVRTATGAGPRSLPGDVLFFVAISASVTKEVVDLGEGGEWPHAALFAAITVSACIYAIRCFTHDRSES